MDNTEQTLQILSNATGTNTELLNIKVSPGVGDIVVQLDVFNQQNESDKVSRPSSTNSINFNSHLEVFQAIMQQVTKTSHETTFLIVLQHLLRIDPNEPLSDVMWKVVEKLVHRSTQLLNTEEADRLLNSSSSHLHTFSCQNCRVEANHVDNEDKVELCALPKAPVSQSLTAPDLSPPPSAQSAAAPFIPPPPPPIPLGVKPSRPPPLAPLEPPASLEHPAALEPPALPRPPPPPGAPPPPLGMAPPLPPPNQSSQANNLLLPQQYAPKSSIKLKTFNWTKIPPHKIMNKLNIWTIMANDRQYKCVEIIDFKGIEGLFCLKATNKTNNNNATDVVDGAEARAKIEKETKRIHLLDAHRSLKVNIFLSQFKGYNSEDIVQLIRNGDNKIMNLEKLKDLIKFFQKDEEIMLLKGFVGDRQRLASAEKFLISMLEVSNFKLRIESMILKEEFELNVAYLEPCLDAIIKAGNDLMKNRTLQEILGVIIIIGNFLNSGGYAGNAAGIKLSSLTKLTEIKANKTGMHLLHLIAMEVKRYNPDLLDLSNELSFLENVSKLNNEQIEKDIKDMEFALDIIKKQIYLPSTEKDIKQQMTEFIRKAEEKCNILNKRVEEFKSLRITMADFFCEDVTTFKVDECFEIFYKFCQQFKQALKENEKRQQLEAQAKMRQKRKEEKLAQTSLKASSKEAKSPSLLARKRLRSSKGCIETNSINFDINSKKNEDDLMTFLQSSKRIRNKDHIQKPRLDKRRSKFNFEREREQHSPLFLENYNENSLSKNHEDILKTECLDNQRETDIVQKSWKRLMQSYKDSQRREKCLTPDVKPARESRQTFVRSNSAVDSKSCQLNNQASIVKIVKTPLRKTDRAFDFSESEVQAYQAATKSNPIEEANEISLNNPSAKSLSHLEICEEHPIKIEDTDAIALSKKASMAMRPRPRLTLKTMAGTVELGCRYSSINEEDLKTTIRKLRTPTLEKTQFYFSPLCALPPKNSLAFRPTTPKGADCNRNEKPRVLSNGDEKELSQDIKEQGKKDNCSSTSANRPPLELRPKPRVTLKTMPSIVELDCRYSSINEEDLKATIKDPRIPTLQKTQFGFSPTTAKTDDWDWAQRPNTLSTVDEEKTKRETYENFKDNQAVLQEPLDKCSKFVLPRHFVIQNKPDKIEQQPKAFDIEKEIKVNSGTETISLAKNKETSLSSKEISGMDSPTDNDKAKLIEKSRSSFSQRLVNKLQSKLRALAPQLSTPACRDYDEKSTTEANDLNIINICSANVSKPLKEESSIALEHTVEIGNKDTANISEQASLKKYVSKSLINLLQNKLKAMSPLKSSPGQ